MTVTVTFGAGPDAGPPVRLQGSLFHKSLGKNHSAIFADSLSGAICAQRFMQPNCNPGARAAPLSPISRALSGILSPQVTARGSAQFPGHNSMGCTDSYGRVASEGIEPGTARSYATRP